MNPKPQTLVILKPVYFPTASHFLFSSVYHKSKPVTDGGARGASPPEKKSQRFSPSCKTRQHDFWVLCILF